MARPRNLRGFVFVDNAPPPDRAARLIGCTCGEAGGGRGLGQITGIPPRQIHRKLVGDPPKDEAEHFIRCQSCGGWIDCRDLGQVFEHEGPLPHPAEDHVQ